MTHWVQSWQPHSDQRFQDPRGTLFHMESLAKRTLLSRQRWKRLSSLPLVAFYYLTLTLLCPSLLQYFWKNCYFKLNFGTHMLQIKSRGLNLNSEFIRKIVAMRTILHSELLGALNFLQHELEYFLSHERNDHSYVTLPFYCLNLDNSYNSEGLLCIHTLWIISLLPILKAFSVAFFYLTSKYLLIWP